MSFAPEFSTSEPHSSPSSRTLMRQFAFSASPNVRIFERNFKLADQEKFHGRQFSLHPQALDSSFYLAENLIPCGFFEDPLPTHHPLLRSHFRALRNISSKCLQLLRRSLLFGIIFRFCGKMVGRCRCLALLLCSAWPYCDPGMCGNVLVKVALAPGGRLGICVA